MTLYPYFVVRDPVTKKPAIANGERRDVAQCCAILSGPYATSALAKQARESWANLTRSFAEARRNA